MKWSMDTHKYMSEITRTALQILVDNNITSDSEPEQIDYAERKLADAGVYKNYESARGRIRRALLTYFKAYGCMDDNEGLTEMGKAFVENKISVQEFSFWYVLNYKYTDDVTTCYPAQLVLKFLKKAGEVDSAQEYVTPYDFSCLAELSDLSGITDEFVDEQIFIRNTDNIPDVDERKIGFDVWAKMFIQAGILYRDYDNHKNLRVKNFALMDWILNSYDMGPYVERGKIVTGIIKYLPVPVLEDSVGNTDLIKNEAPALAAFLFEGIDEHIINQYIIRNKECSLDVLSETLGLGLRSKEFYKPFLGLERLVGFYLMGKQSPPLKTIGEILASAEITESKLNEHAEEHASAINEEERLAIGTNVLLYGVPGSGKSWTIEHEYCKEGSKVERLVFHPDYTYSDFIGQILPVVSEDGQVSYEFTPGPFTNILRDSYHDPMTEYILIIEEINRGNAPAIFGEIFQLLDRKIGAGGREDAQFPIGTSEYGISNQNIAQIVYGDPHHKVRIPSNLSIIATMNTSDQNVFTLDTAFQRRWNMRLIENTFENVRDSLANAKILDTNVTWETFCTTVNKIIVGNKAKMASAEDKRLGVYFVHENDLKYDDKANSPGNDLRGEYNTLLQAERDKSIEGDQITRLSNIRKALQQNRKFPEKVIKYLWDDAFKFNPQELFDTSRFDNLEDIIRHFVFTYGSERFAIFKQTVWDTLYSS